MVTVSLAAAVICFAGQCYPALVGKDTPVGEYQMTYARVKAPGYGGDALLFNQDAKGAFFAVHRVWTLKPEQRRVERLHGPASGRKTITDGCVNLMPEVYNSLLDCCSNQKLIIKE